MASDSGFLNALGIGLAAVGLPAAGMAVASACAVAGCGFVAGASGIYLELFGGEKFKPADMPERIDLGGTTEGTGTPGAGSEAPLEFEFFSDSVMYGDSGTEGNGASKSGRGGVAQRGVAFNRVGNVYLFHNYPLPAFFPLAPFYSGWFHWGSETFAFLEAKVSKSGFLDPMADAMSVLLNAGAATWRWRKSNNSVALMMVPGTNSDNDLQTNQALIKGIDEWSGKIYADVVATINPNVSYGYGEIPVDVLTQVPNYSLTVPKGVPLKSDFTANATTCTFSSDTIVTAVSRERDNHILVKTSSGEYMLFFWYSKSGGYLNEAQMKHNASIVYSHLRANGWTQKAIWGLLGNIEWESGMNPDDMHSNGGAYGIVQWHPVSDYTDWAAQNGYPNRSLVGQLKCLLYEQANSLRWQIRPNTADNYSVPHLTFSQYVNSSLDERTLARAWCIFYEWPNDLITECGSPGDLTTKPGRRAESATNWKKICNW